MKLGILGGIGPEASCYFYAEIIKRLQERGRIRRNADYPQIIINSINAPELTTLQVTDEMLAPYVEGLKELAALQPDYIVMACNSIHVFREQLIKQSGYSNISDVAQIVAKAVGQRKGKICTLATPATVISGLYNIPGREYSDPAESELIEIGNVVANYNATGEIKKNKEMLMRIANAHQKDGASIYIAGCTEVSELLRSENDITLIDTLELLIEDTLQRIQPEAD
ncbi:MAG TPA: aspartate/glutamate racemase family protein [Candidatus Paceibacterota bacterium]|nr:aspartate/glutamate racemase family protein [Candidatus Paceibacterota bacterium]